MGEGAMVALILVFLFTGGVIVLMSWHGTSRWLRTLCAALPLGSGLWSVCWMGTAWFGPLPLPIGGNLIASGLFAACVAGIWGWTRRPLPLTPRQWTTLILAAGILIGLSYLFHWSAIYFLSFDSHVMITWSVNPHYSLINGFPIVNLAIANLSRMVGPDYYLYPLHSLSSVSLLILVGEEIHHRLTELRLPRAQTWLLTVLAPLTMACSSMTLLQAVFVNHHVAVAIYGLLVFSDWGESRGTDTLRALLLTLLVMTRMEGILLAAIILLCQAGTPGALSVSRAWAVGWRTGLLSSPYLIYLIALCWNGGFITGRQYLVLALTFCAVLLVIRGSTWRGLRWVNGRFWLMLVAGNGALVAALVLWKPAHMLDSLWVFAQNMFDPGLYGYTFALIALGAVVHALTRGAGWLKPHATDAYYIHGVSVILVNLALVAFREPFHRSWQDSGTRLLMHVLPGLIVWLGVLVARLPEKYVLGGAPASRTALDTSTESSSR